MPSAMASSAKWIKIYDFKWIFSLVSKILRPLTTPGLNPNPELDWGEGRKEE